MSPRSPWRDSSGRTLDEYPRPSVAVDVAVLTVPLGSDIPEEQRGLHVLLTKPTGSAARHRWSLPGTFIHPGETLHKAALRALDQKAHLRGLDPQQLHVFDRPHRDHRGWVISAGHLDVIPWTDASAAINEDGSATLMHVGQIISGAQPLPYDHDEIVSRAIYQVRADHSTMPDPYDLLREPFSLRELEQLHRAVDPGGTPAKDTFRRSMEPLLKPTGDLTEGARGKPARLFVHA